MQSFEELHISQQQIVAIDCRYAIFEQRCKLTQQSIDQFIQENETQKKSNQFIIDPLFTDFIKLSNTEGLKLLLFFTSKNEFKLKFFQYLVEKNLKEDFQNAQIQPIFVLKNQIQETINENIQKLLKSSIESVSVITHNPKTFFFNQNGNYKNYSILFASYSQNIEKKRAIEQQFYAQNKVDYHISLLLQFNYFLKFQKSMQEIKTQQKIYRIGYIFDLKKQAEFTKKLILIPHYPIVYFPVDFRKAYDEIPFQMDVLLHRISDLTKKINVPELTEIIKIQMDNYYNFEKKFQNQVGFVNSLEQFNVISSRIAFQDCFDKMFQYPELKQFMSQYPQITLKVPKILQFNSNSENIDNLNFQDIEFPVIIKTVNATSSSTCHDMALCFNQQAVKQSIVKKYQNQQVIIQEFINHDNRIQKIYVIGDNVIRQVRASFPNINAKDFENKGTDDGIWYFNSQKSIADQLPIQHSKVLDNYNSDLNEKVTEEIARNITKYFKFYIYGFDIVIKSGTQQWYIIDINNLPGLKDTTDLDKKFLDLYIRVLKDIGKQY